MSTVVERLEMLFRQYPHLASGDHDKELIATYLHTYHGHTIPLEVLEAMPSFETIRRARQKFTADSR